MRLLLIIILCFLGFNVFAQIPVQVQRTPSSVLPTDQRLKAGLNLYIPVAPDTTLNGGPDSVGMLLYTRMHGALWYRDTLIPGRRIWIKLLSTKDGGSIVGITSLNGQTNQIQIFGEIGAGALGWTSSSGVHTLSIPNVSAINTRGLLPYSDWQLFNSKLSNITDLITAGTGIVRTGSGTPESPYVFSATGAGAGVSSVGLVLPSSLFNVTGSPVTSIGNLTGTLSNQNPYSVFNRGAGLGEPSFSPLTESHIPLLTSSKISNFASSVRNSISVTTFGNSGPSSYDPSSGILNIPNYAGGGGSAGGEGIAIVEF